MLFYNKGVNMRFDKTKFTSKIVPSSTADDETRSLAIEENRNFVKDGQVYIYGEFDFTIFKFVLPKLMNMIDDFQNQKLSMIKFHINSPGGYLSVLQNLLALVERAKDEGIIVQTNVYSYAYSCASMLAASGTKGFRLVSPFAEHLVHLGCVWSGLATNDVEAEREAQAMMRHFEWVRSVYSQYATIKNLKKVIHDDNYYIVGEDIIKNGLADGMMFTYGESKK